MYFIGVSTQESLVMDVFGSWADLLELGDCALVGVDIPPRADAREYREIVDFIAEDPLSLGALVTTHKLDLFAACEDRFGSVDDFALLMREISSISKRDGRLVGHAKDAITARLALEAFIPPSQWVGNDGAAFLAGAGGAATAIAWALRGWENERNRPSRILVSDLDPERLLAIRRAAEQAPSSVPLETVHCHHSADNDAVVAALPAASLVVNATGLGKDAPGSPLTDDVVFPPCARAWELNYRGDLRFCHQARTQAVPVEDGFRYFVYGWLAVIAEVFHRPICERGPDFSSLLSVAQSARDRRIT